MSNYNSSDALRVAKRDLEKRVQFVTRYMLQPAVPAAFSTFEGRSTAVRWTEASDLANDLYYFHANAANCRAFEGKLQTVLARHSALKDDRVFMQLVADARAAYIVVAGAKAREDERIAAKRASVKAKAALKDDLNLQEGVSLKGVDVGQYKVILAGLEPVRLHVYATQLENLTDRRASLVGKLAAVSWDATQAFPSNRENNWKPKPPHFNAFFKLDPANTNYYTQKGELEVLAYIRKSAERFALAYIQGYAAKLAVKTGEAIANDPALAPLAPVLKVTAASVSSTTLWQDSVATIELSPDVRRFLLRFHTQIIWNRSCLGKVFNQYPTRRLA